jgi:hypothetical protein
MVSLEPIEETALANNDGWEWFLFVMTGSLGLGFLIHSRTEHIETVEGWTPPAVFDQREIVPSRVTDWLSPAKLHRLAAARTAPETAAAPSDQER